ncbi:MAG: CHAT domain-containing protein, partial [Caldilineaceae bacterium]
MSTPIAPFRLEPPADLLERQPQLRRQSHELAQRYASGQLVDEAMLQRLGQALWQVLGQDDALAQARQAAGVQPLPLILSSSDAASQQLPWETLYHPTYGFLARADGFTLSRANPALTPTLPPLENGPLRVLLFTSLPDNLDAVKGRLDVEEEQAQVLAALNPWIVEGLVELIMPDDGRFSTLQALLKSEQPHLLFLSGHGKFHPGAAGAPPAATFLFEGETAGSHAVSETELAHALLGSKLGCVVLSACESGMGASDALTHGLSWRLSSIGIPQVIGMRESILDRAGTLFARAFCDAVARRRTVAEALQAGRQAITTPLKDAPWLADAAPGLAERSLGQWALPMLISHDPTHPLIDWRFTPHPQAKIQSAQTLQTIYLPPRFIGRRRELRDLQRQLRQGRLQQLLITGPGGQGKTALAGKLAQDLRARGYALFAWSPGDATHWRKFELDLLRSLSKERLERYQAMLPLYTTESEKAEDLLPLLIEQHQRRLLLFFDNLETIQDPANQTLTDARATAWIKVAQSLTDQGLLLLLTSRWRLPGWPAADHLALAHASYGDFLQMARRQLPPALLRDDRRLRALYTTLHGNGRGLTFFAAALQGLTPAAEADFLTRLAQATVETQNDMALAQIVSHLPDPSRQLLTRLPAYATPVPLEGIVKLAGELPDPPALLQRLLAVSLVEPSFAVDLGCDEVQLSPLVADWLARQGVPPPALSLLQAAAAYQHYLFRHERSTLPQAITTHAALRRAEQIDQADRLALDWIVGPLNLDGLYHTLLTDWLPAICQSPNPQTRGEALGQTGKQLLHIGQYTAALRDLEQSLKIRQEIGDKQGEGTTLNNISQIFKARGDYETALRYLEQSLNILQEIGDKQGEGTTLNNISQIF